MIKIFFLFLEVIFIVSCFDNAFADDDNVVVKISSGKILGKTFKSQNDNNFYAFRGIPFAKPPVGNLRFMPPQPPDSWKGVLDDKNKNKICIQLSSELSSEETEDCLYLNVYTPQLPKINGNVSLPVMYFIYGGAFVTGSAVMDLYGPQFLMDYDIILVTVQYRVGFFGFISTEDLSCPGNNGFKDQQFGLKWVQENIRNFGGDPERVTIFGQSAGAASIGYQLLGNNGNGLFRGAIQNSGSSLGTWSLQRNPRKIAYEFGKRIDPNIDEATTNAKELLEFLRNVDVMTIKTTCAEMFGEGLIGGFFTTNRGYVFSGVIEPEHDGAFLTEKAYGKFKNGNYNIVPLLIGFNSEETIFLHNDDTFEDRLKYYLEHPESFVSPDFHLTDEKMAENVGENFSTFYFGNKTINEYLGRFIKFFSDSTFVVPAIKEAELTWNYTDVYLYEFAYSGMLGRNKKDQVIVPGAETVGHGEELQYIFHRKETGNLDDYPEEDIITMKRMLSMWTNFVKHLNPTPETLDGVVWPKITSTKDMQYLLINETLSIQQSPKKETMNEFDKLYDSFAIPPLDTF